MKRRTPILLGLLALAPLAYAATGLYQVLPGEAAVVRRFGRVLPERPEPGLHLGLPWGMDRVDRVAVDQLRRVVVGYQEGTGAAAMPAGQLLTGDHNLVNVQATIYYKVRPDEAADYVTQADRVDGLAERAAEAVMAEWVASRTVDEALLNGKVGLREALVKEVGNRLAPYGLGVEVLDAPVALIAPPDEVKSAFDDVAREQTRIETKVNNAEQEAESQWKSALSYQYQKEQETAAYTSNRKLMARREADAFLERLRKYREGRRANPDYLRQIWDEERGKLFAALKANGQLGLLDDHIGPDGLDLNMTSPLPKKNP
jgi:modulator of FtsH protease HflK